MALEFAHGAIQVLSSDAVNTTYTVSGLSFQPKALRFYTLVGTQSAADVSSLTLHSKRGIGFATSTSNRRWVGSYDGDAAGSMDCAGAYSAAFVAGFIDTAAPSVPTQVDLNAINSDGFQLILDQTDSVGITIFWEAWGGSDITVAVAGNFEEPSATGDQDTTVTGFVSGATDQVVMFAGCQHIGTAPQVSAVDSGFCVGFATSGADADNVVVLGNNDDGSANSDTDGYAKTGECVAMITVAGGNPNARAKMTQFNTDGFRLNWIARAVTGRRYIFLAIKGGQWKAGSFTIDPTTVNNTGGPTGLAFQPIGLCLMSRHQAESTAGTSTAQDTIDLGTGTSSSSRRTMGVTSANGTGNAEIAATIEYDQVLVLTRPSISNPGKLDIQSINSDGFTLIADDSFGQDANTWIGYLTFASAAVTNISINVNDSTPATEFIDIQRNPLLIDVVDAITITESQSFLFDPPPILFREFKQGDSAGVTTITTSGLTNGYIAGDLLILSGRWSTEGINVSVSDSDGGTDSDYTLIRRQTLGGANAVEIGMWYRKLTAAMSSGTTFTLTTDTNFGTGRVNVVVVSGWLDAELSDDNSGDTGSTPVASLQTGEVTPSSTFPGAFLITSVTARTDATWTIDSGYTEITEGVGGRLPSAYRVAMEVAAFNPTWTPDASEEMVAIHAVFVNAQAADRQFQIIVVVMTGA